MHARIRRMGAPVAVLAAAACTDAGVVTRPPVSPLTTSIAPAPGQGDPGPQWPTAIHTLSGDILLPFEPDAYPAQGTVTAFMRYDSYHARLGARANITGPDPQSYEYYPEERHQFWGFFDNTLNAQWGMYVGGPCGNVIEANLRGEVWWIYQGGWSIDTNERTQTVARRQADCPESVPGGGAGPETGGTVRCYTYTVDHYWYYPDTGVYEYRYSTTKTWCEPYES